MAFIWNLFCLFFSLSDIRHLQIAHLTISIKLFNWLKLKYVYSWILNKFVFRNEVAMKQTLLSQQQNEETIGQGINQLNNETLNILIHKNRPVSLLDELISSCFSSLFFLSLFTFSKSSSSSSASKIAAFASDKPLPDKKRRKVEVREKVRLRLERFEEDGCDSITALQTISCLFKLCL